MRCGEVSQCRHDLLRVEGRIQRDLQIVSIEERHSKTDLLE